MADFSYIGVGKLYGRIAGSNAGLLHFGNVSALAFAITEEKKELKDYTQGGGGVYNSVTRIDSVELSMTAHDLNADNMAMATFGVAGAITAGSVTDEAAGAAYKSALIPTAYPLDTAQTVTVKHAQNAAAARANTTAYSLNAYVLPATPNGYVYKATTAGTSGGSVPTYPTTVGSTVVDGTVTWTNVGRTTLIATTDYILSGAGIEMTASPGISDGEAVVISYTKLVGYSIESLLRSAQKYELFFAGLNEARSGKPVNVRIHKCTFGPAANLGLISEDYLALELTGTVEKDTSKNGTTISQYFKTDIAT
jgi:hypothetical protein